MEAHQIEKTIKITKASLLKQIKQLDRYKKEYFSYTVAKLQEVLKEIQDERVHIMEPVFEDESEEEVYVKPIKTYKKKQEKEEEVKYVEPVKKVIQEDQKPVKPYKKKQVKTEEAKVTEYVKEEKKKFNKIIAETEPEPEVVQETEPEPEYVVPNKQKFKKDLIISKQAPPKKVPILKRVLISPDEYKKDIQKILRDLKVDLDDLLNDFDGEENLTDEDSDIIKNEYNNMLEKAYDSIESILEKYPSDLNYHKILERKIKLIDDKVHKFLIN